MRSSTPKRGDDVDDRDGAKLAALKRHWAYEATDRGVSHALYHDDAVLEFPQSRERFEGRQSFLAWRKQYPAKVEANVRRIRGRGHLWVAEVSVRYDGGPWNFGVGIHEFRGDKVARETVYGGEAWEAPEWRAPWRAPWQDESLG